MWSRFIVNGGRFGARRLFVITALAMCALTPARVIYASAPAQAGGEVTVREQAGVYTVVATFSVPQSPASVLSVLTDYEQIPRFMPDVKTSVVRQRLADRTVVEQEAVSRVMLFSKRVHLLLEVQEQSDGLRFRDASRRSFEHYDGAWQITQEGGRTVIAYQLRAKPSFDVPQFLLTRLLKRDANQMIERLCAEIAARSGRATAVTPH